jgi:hypothetical protein
MLIVRFEKRLLRSKIRSELRRTNHRWFPRRNPGEPFFLHRISVQIQLRFIWQLRLFSLPQHAALCDCEPVCLPVYQEFTLPALPVISKKRWPNTYKKYTLPSHAEYLNLTPRSLVDTYFQCDCGKCGGVNYERAYFIVIKCAPGANKAKHGVI